MSFLPSIYGRLTYQYNGTSVGVFTVNGTDGNTYTIVATLPANGGKWTTFWSYKVLTTDLDNNFVDIVSKTNANVLNYFSGLDPTSDQINDEVVDMVSQF